MLFVLRKNLKKKKKTTPGDGTAIYLPSQQIWVKNFTPKIKNKLFPEEF
jgi:hypothetical protein